VFLAREFLLKSLILELSFLTVTRRELTSSRQPPQLVTGRRF